jgi:hypothetical protein
MNTTHKISEISEITPLILAGDGYQLTISPEAEARKAALLTKSSAITAVGDNDESGKAQFQTRSLAAMRIEVEKSRKLVKEPVNRIGKMIDQAAADFLIEITAEEGRIKQLINNHAEEVMRIKTEKEAAERAAFDAARAAREAAEEGGIAAVLAAKKATAEKLEASNQVASTKLADGIRFAWDFEVVDLHMLAAKEPMLVKIEPRRAEILAELKDMEEHGYTVESLAATFGIRAFKKPIVSSR